MDDAVKVLNSICQQIWKSQQWSQDWKKSVFISIPKKGNAKERSNYRTIALISHATKVMLKILQARLQQYMNHELPDVQAGFRKGKGTKDQIANSHLSICPFIHSCRTYASCSCYVTGTVLLLGLPGERDGQGFYFYKSSELSEREA